MTTLDPIDTEALPSAAEPPSGRQDRISRVPKIAGWGAFSLVLLILGPIGLAVVMLDSRPGGSGAEPAAKILVGAMVLGCAALLGWTVKASAALLLRLAQKG